MLFSCVTGVRMSAKKGIFKQIKLTNGSISYYEPEIESPPKNSYVGQKGLW